MRTQDVGWHGLRGFLTGVRGYVGPVQDSIGSMIALAEAAGATPIVDAAAATASAPKRNRLMFFSLLITPAFRRVPLRPHQGTKVAFYLAIPCSVPQEHRHRCRRYARSHRRCAERCPCRPSSFRPPEVG